MSSFELLFFMTWKTYLDAKLIDEEWADRLVGLLPEFASRAQARVVEVAVLPNHVHVLVEASIRIDLPMLAQRMKAPLPMGAPLVFQVLQYLFCRVCPSGRWPILR